MLNGQHHAFQLVVSCSLVLVVFGCDGVSTQPDDKRGMMTPTLPTIA